MSQAGRLILKMLHCTKTNSSKWVTETCLLLGKLKRYIANLQNTKLAGKRKQPGKNSPKCRPAKKAKINATSPVPLVPRRGAGVPVENLGKRKVKYSFL